MAINFTQGTTEQRAARCKDLLPMLRDLLISHGWNIPAQNFTTAHWFVAQKRSNRGDILTYAFKELWYPNFGNPQMYMSFATNDSVDAATGAYISAFNPLTNTLEHAYSGNTQINIASTTAAGHSLQYYNATKNDTDLTPYYVFYSLSFGEDWFYLKFRGNPSTTGPVNSQIYCGPFEYNDTLSPDVQAYRGLWGAFSGASYTGQFVNPSTTEGWVNATFTDPYTLNLLGYYKDREFITDNPPICQTILYQISTNKFVVVPPANMMFSTSDNSTYVDEVHLFGVGDTKRALYKRTTNNSYLVWIADTAVQLTSTDVGTGYRLEWLSPDLPSLIGIELYASISGPISSRTDINATLINTWNSPPQGEVMSFVDTDSARYNADTVYYLVVAAFQSEPETQYTLKSPGSHLKVTRTVDAFVTMTPNSYDKLVYEKSTNSKTLSTYYNPMCSLSMEDQTATTSIVDAARPGTPAVLASGTTATKSVPGKIGRALSLTGNNYITLSNMMTDGWHPNLCAISMWARHPGTVLPKTVMYNTGSSYVHFTSSGGYPSYAYYMFGAHLLEYPDKMHFTPIGYFNSGGGYGDYRPVMGRYSSAVDNSWHHYLLLKKGQQISVYKDNVLILNGVGDPMGGSNHAYGYGGYSTAIPVYSAMNADSPNLGSMHQVHYIGRNLHQYIGNYGNFEVDVTEVFTGPVSEAQRNHIWNGGNGQLTSVVGTEKAYRVISIPGSAGESILYKIASPYNAKGRKYIKFDAKSTRVGSNFRVGFGETPDSISIGTATPITISTSDWEPKIIDISMVPDQFKDTINYLKIFITDDSATNIIAVKNVTSSYTA